MTIEENINLAQYTTFKIGGPAKFFCAVHNEDEIVEAVKFASSKNIPIFIIGGGSNILISDKGFNGLVLKMENKGISYSNDRVKVAAGETWDELVEDTVSKGFGGLENLSAIPGTVGAVPIQNIGAYGCDVSSVIESVKVLNTEDLQFIDLSNADCSFAYRDSIFKHQKGRYVVVSVVFKLEKNGKTNIVYKDLAEYFSKKDLSNPSPREVREAVINIRWNKLPDWHLWGTAGSFFKNPIIPIKQYIDLKQRFPDLPSYPESDGKVKVSLGWIIDKVCNAKKWSVGNVSVYDRQALVVVAQPGATSVEVTELVQKIRNKVREKTGLEIEAEVEWVN